MPADEALSAAPSGNPVLEIFFFLGFGANIGKMPDPENRDAQIYRFKNDSRGDSKRDSK